MRLNIYHILDKNHISYFKYRFKRFNWNLLIAKMRKFNKSLMDRSITVLKSLIKV